MVKNFISQRIKKLQSSLLENQSILLSKNSDIFYFSSFADNVPEERIAFCLISKKSAHLILQAFSSEPAKFIGKILIGCSPIKLAEHLNNLKNELNVNEIFLDLENLNVEEFRAISKISDLKIEALDKKKIWQLRTQKDSSEIKKIKIAIRITKQAVLETIKELKVGLTELEVKKILENKIRQHNFCELAFPTIIAFDKNSISPHHQPSQKKLKNGTVVLIDAGAKYQEYCADMTRTIFFKEKDAPKKIQQKEIEFKRVLKVVKKAYQQAEKLLSYPDLKIADLDLACRKYIEEKGYAKNFIHTTGHGLGIDIHEPPSIYKTNIDKLTPGMAFTIEPGIYLEGKFGVRWENTVFTENLSPSGTSRVLRKSKQSIK